MSIYTLFLILFGLFATIGVAMGFLLGRRLRIRCVREPECPRCGYAVKGLNTLICPECGADFREVGIVAPEMRKPLRLGWCLVIWTIFLPVPAYTISYLIIQVAPTIREISQSAAVTKPLSGQFHRIEFEVDAYGLRWPWEETMHLRPTEPDPGLPDATITVRIWTRKADRPGGTIAVTHETGAWQFRDSAGRVLKQGESSFGSMDLLRCFEALGMDVTDRHLNSEAARMSTVFSSSMGVMPNVLRGNLRTATLTITRSRDYSGTLPWLRWTLLGFWLLLWFVGIVCLFRWTKRERAAM